MLTEDDLRELIDSAASEAPDASPLPPDLFHVETAARPRRRFDHNKLAPVLGVAAALIVVVGGIAWVSSLGGSSYKSITYAAGTFSSVANSIGGGVPTTAPTQAFNLEENAAGGGTNGAGGPAGPSAPPIENQTTAGASPSAAIVDSAKIIKNGSLEIRVGKGAVTESVNRLTALATGLGGYVSDTRTTTSEQSGSQATAMVSVRVPAAAFEQLLADTSKLGEVRATTTSGQDVTAQFTDIDAQLSALTSTRDQFLLVLGEAKNVNDILQVQDRITQVQIQIDQLEGQKRLLTDQTSFGTLSVTLLEPGATAAAPPADDDNKDLGDAWRSARNSFVDGIEWIVSVTGTLALLALCSAALGTAGWFVYRAMRRRALTL
jgi:hypothetical protein